MNPFVVRRASFTCDSLFSCNPSVSTLRFTHPHSLLPPHVPSRSDYSVKGQNDDVTFEDSLDFGDTVHPCDMSVILEVLALNSYDIDKAKEDVISRVSDFVEEMTKKKSAEAGGKQGEIRQQQAKQQAMHLIKLVH